MDYNKIKNHKIQKLTLYSVFSIYGSGVNNVKKYCLKTQKLSVIINQAKTYTHSQNCNIGGIE